MTESSSRRLTAWAGRFIHAGNTFRGLDPSAAEHNIGLRGVVQDYRLTGRHGGLRGIELHNKSAAAA